MRLRSQIISMCILGAILPHLVTSFDTRRRREVPDAPENYKYFLQPFVVPEAERIPQPDPLLKAQSVSESTSAKQYKPPLLTLPSPNQPTSGYQPPLPLLASVPRTLEVPKPSVPVERKPLLYPAADTTELSQSPPDRRSGAVDNRSKAVGSSHHPSQAIHQVPASEIQSDKGASAKDRDSAKNDEYVVYYYYYYDNDTNSNNLTLNFDDIPSLDSYDDTKSSKEPEKSASSRSIAANVNSLTPSTQDEPKETPQRVSPSPKPSSPSGASQARSLSSADAGVESVIRADKPDNTVEDTLVQPLKPVSNVFRYGSNEVPRFPVLPNFIVSEVPKEVKTEEQSTPDTLSTPPLTTLPASTASGILNEERLQPEVDSDDANNVLDSDTKVVEENEEKVTSESSTTTTTTTTTEPPTTTEITTTTEKSRRRPGGVNVGVRRRFNSGPAPPAARGRQTSARSTTGTSAVTSSTTTTTTTTTTSAPRSFRGGSSNRLRPRQPLGGNRPRTALSGSTSSKPEEDTGSTKVSESTSTTASRSRSTPAPRRFAGGRNAASRSASTTSTTASLRLRTTSRPRPNLITRNRPRPGFLRPRGGKEEEPEPVETTTPEPEVTEEKDSNSANPEEETEAEDQEESESPDTETPEAQEETEEPTTTEKNRFAALFRPRNRNGGNRPRPVIANRPSRSRR